MHCRDPEKSRAERMDASRSAHALDVIICDRSASRARLTVAGLHRAEEGLSTVRVREISQLHRLMFEQGLFTREPQIPRLLLIERTIPHREYLDVALQRHWRTLWLPLIEIVSSAERFRTTCIESCIVDTGDQERFIASVARAARPHLQMQSLPAAKKSAPFLTSTV